MKSNGKRVIDDEFMKVIDAAHYLHVSESTIYRLINTGTLPAVRFGEKCTRITHRALQEYLKKSTK